jgi:hypothetical protein
MEATGIVVGLIDVPQEHTADYNRWYDFDHLPEFAALPGMLFGRRYVAPPEYQSVRPPSALPELADGRGAYCTTYFVGDNDLDRVQKHWSVLGDDLRKHKRIFRHGKIADVGFYRLDFTQVREDIPAAPHAAPYLGNTGIMIVLTEVADAARRDDVDRWFREMHAQDLLETHGVTAAMRFSRVDRPAGRYMNLYMLEGDPLETKRDLDRRIPDWQTRGRVPSPGGASQILFQSVYRPVLPMQYDFQVS